MGYKVLVTIDLPKITENERQKFYEFLESKKWTKIERLTTAWRVSFKDDVTRDGAISTTLNDLKNAKINSKVSEVEYALQLERHDIQKGNL